MTESSKVRSRSNSGKSSNNKVPNWIEENITKAECVQIIPSRKCAEKCGCGRRFAQHDYLDQNYISSHNHHDQPHLHPNFSSTTLNNSELYLHNHTDQPQLYHKNVNSLKTSSTMSSITSSSKWSWKRHTKSMPTDAWGTIEFQGGPHPLKAKFVRCHRDTPSDRLLHLINTIWNVPLPKLVITFIDDMNNFKMQPKLSRLFTRGLIKAVNKTGAWLITNGLDCGSACHVGNAIKEELQIRNNKIVALGIAPWGMVHNKASLVNNFVHTATRQGMIPGNSLNKDHHIKPYFISANNVSINEHHSIPLNATHNYFLLVDNGTEGQHGSEHVLRSRLEHKLAGQFLQSYTGQHEGMTTRTSQLQIPVVGLLIEGGLHTFTKVTQMVTGNNAAPVVICDGSGPAADVLSFVYKHVNEDGKLSPELKDQVIATISITFYVDNEVAQNVYTEIEKCMKKKDMITIFRVDDNQDIDISLLTALLKVHENIPSEQLAMTIAWNRVDLAKTQVLTRRHNWPHHVLSYHMMEALVGDNVEFIRALLEYDINIQEFLTPTRLEILYLQENSYLEILAPKLGIKNPKCITLRVASQAIETLMGSGYHHIFSNNLCIPNVNMAISVDKDEDITPNMDYNNTINSTGSIGLHLLKNLGNAINILRTGTRDSKPYPELFRPYRYPYTEIFQWALLGRRYSMAKFMMWSGEESIAKALMAVNLLKGIRVFFDEDLEAEYTDELDNWIEFFESEAVRLQEFCYKQDIINSNRLLTYELSCFGHHTCLSLAFQGDCKLFLSQRGPQGILNDLWFGGMKNMSNSQFKIAFVLLSTIFFPMFPFLIWVFSPFGSSFIQFKTRQELAQLPCTLEEYLGHRYSISSSSSASSSTVSSSDDNSSDSNNQSDFAATSSDHSVGSHPIKSKHNLAFLNNLKSRIKGNSREHNAASKTSLHLSRSCSSAADSAKRSGIFTSKRRKQVARSRSSACEGYVNKSFVNQHPASSPINSESQNEYHNVVHQQETDTNLTNDSHKSDKGTRNPVFHIAIALQNNNLSTTEMHTSPIMKEIQNSNYQDSGDPVWLGMPGLGVTGREPSKGLSWKNKIYEFYSAPVTRYWLYTVFFLFFVVIFMGFVLIDFENHRLYRVEYFLYAYALTYCLDIFREISMCEGTTCLEKLVIHLMKEWNVYDLIMCIFTVTAIVLRLLCMLDTEFHMHARNIMILAESIWIIRIFALFLTSKILGPWMYMTRIMALAVMPPAMLFLALPLASFGVIRQGIMFQTTSNFSMQLIKEVFLKPYFMLYGEVYATEIDPADWTDQTAAKNPAAWLVPFSMFFFLLMACIISLSIIIAQFNDIIVIIRQKSSLVFKFYRYSVIMQYKSKPLLPPPFIVISWCYMLLTNYCRRSSLSSSSRDKSKPTPRHKSSGSVKLFLNLEELEELHDFEEECVADYCRNAGMKFQMEADQTNWSLLGAESNPQQQQVGLSVEAKITENNGVQEMLETITARLEDVNRKLLILQNQMCHFNNHQVATERPINNEEKLHAYSSLKKSKQNLSTLNRAASTDNTDQSMLKHGSLSSRNASGSCDFGHLAKTKKRRSSLPNISSLITFSPVHNNYTTIWNDIIWPYNDNAGINLQSTSTISPSFGAKSKYHDQKLARRPRNLQNENLQLTPKTFRKNKSRMNYRSQSSSGTGLPSTNVVVTEEIECSHSPTDTKCPNIKDDAFYPT